MAPSSPRLKAFCAAAVELIASGASGRGVAELLRERTAAELADVAAKLVHSTDRIGIVTGFYVPDAAVPGPETDGPLATAVLADVLTAIGCEVDVITDHFCAAALQAFFASCDVPIGRLVAVSWSDGAAGTAGGTVGGRDAVHGGAAGGTAAVGTTDRTCAAGAAPSRLRRESRSEPVDWLTGYDALLAIERAGPCCGPEGGPTVAAGAGPGNRGAHVNIRGECIDAWCEDLGRLFDAARERGIFTAGIGDGGNEIGFGRLHELGVPQWEAGQWTGPLCQTVTDRLVASDVSHWGGLTLAVAVAMQAAAAEVLHRWPTGRHAAVLLQAAQRRLLVDGITRRYEPTIDGLPLSAHLFVWKRLTGLAQMQGC